MDGVNLGTFKPPKHVAAKTSNAADVLLEIYRQMVRCRLMDERVWLLNRQGKAAIVASAQGHEACQIASVWALDRTKDHFFIYYRDLGVLIGLGVSVREIMLGYAAKDGEPLSSARQFPTHGASRGHNVVNLSNVVGTQIPQAVGSALASKMRRDKGVTIVYFGDGASSVGDCHEAMNFAAIHKLPVIFMCENNKYAISVPLSKQMAIDSIAGRAEGYGMPGISIDGSDVREVLQATDEAASRARSGKGPTIIEAMVERYLPHTSDDDDSRYRDISEIEAAKSKDPLLIHKKYLLSSGILTESMDVEICKSEKIRVDDATEFVEDAPYPDIDTFFNDVYA